MKNKKQKKINIVDKMKATEPAKNERLVHLKSKHFKCHYFLILELHLLCLFILDIGLSHSEGHVGIYFNKTKLK